ncbi:MAG: hypothetical protein AABZ30_01275 [Myxococcota bacterium]
MNLAKIQEELEAACAQVGVKVVYAELTGEGMSSGGLCKVKGEWRVIVDRRSSPGEKVSVLARALATFDLEAVFLSPHARELVARHTAAGMNQRDEP